MKRITQNGLLSILFVTMFNSPSFMQRQTLLYNDPNIVILLADDLGYGDLGCYGNTTIKTPYLDKLASEGLRLTNFYSAAPVCSPSRVGLLTGRIPQRDGIGDWIRENSEVFLPKETPTIAKLVKLFGYQTAMFGKWHLSGKLDGSQPTPADHGFVTWFATQNNALPTHENPKNFIRNGKGEGAREGYSSTIIVDEALKWLQQRDQKKPFMLYLPFHSPHERVATASQFVKQYANAENENQAQYFGNVTQLDTEIGRFLAQLDALNLRENTIVIFTSDNGPETLNRYKGSDRSYGTPGAFNKARLRGMKLHLYEGGIRVPAIIRWPSIIKAGRVSDAVTSGMDVMPTLLDSLGIALERDDRVDGVSFGKLFVSNAWERDKLIYWQYDQAISANDAKNKPTPKYAVREGDYKLLIDHEFKSVEFFNLKLDPGEANDLAKTEFKRWRPMIERARLIQRQILIGEK